MAVTTTSLKKAYPMDSVVTEMDDDGLPVYDRAYNASDLRSVMARILTDGVFPDDGDELSVEVRSGAWSVGTGTFVANGLMAHVEEPCRVLPQSDIKTGKYAYVVAAARFDSTLRDGAVYAVISDEPSYEPRRDESIWELVLARIDWRGTVRDLRMDGSVCGPVAPVVPVDTESFMLELKTAVSQFNLNVGEVEGLASGMTPTVTVRKPEQAGGDVYIDFGIPCGAPGLPGKDGDTAPTVYVQEDEPPRKAGNVWFVDDASSVPHVITSLLVYESGGLYPGAGVFPDADVYPGGSGGWVSHVLSPALSPGSGGGGGSGASITVGEGEPTDHTPSGLYIDSETGVLQIRDPNNLTTGNYIRVKVPYRRDLINRISRVRLFEVDPAGEATAEILE